jgi:hypothetical protein
VAQIDNNANIAQPIWFIVVAIPPFNLVEGKVDMKNSAAPMTHGLASKTVFAPPVSRCCIAELACSIGQAGCTGCDHFEVGIPTPEPFIHEVMLGLPAQN